ncbi:MAG: diguanylate cyclase [candidate division NC10 bacterium]|nr:diguanylate cyclase [candidate division NC10 bacterium]
MAILLPSQQHRGPPSGRDISPPGARLTPFLPYAARVGSLAIIYFLAAKLGLSLAGMHQNVSLVWPPTGIALAALLLFGFRLWPGVALGAFLVNALTDVPLATAAGIATGNTLEAITGAYLLHRVARFRNSLERLQDVLGFVGLAAGLSTTVSATIGVASLCLGAAAPWNLYGTLWWQWWLGDAMGALVAAPVLLTWGAKPRVRISPRQVAEAGVLLLGLVTVGFLMFGGWFTTDTPNYTWAYAFFPFVIWAALRFGPWAATAATLVVSVIAISGTVRAFGPFLGKTLAESLMLLHTFMSAVAVTALVLAAAITQRRQVEEALRQSEKRYRELFENATEVVYTLDLAGNFTSLNKAGEEVAGYTREEALRMNFAQLAAGPYRELARQMIARQTAEEAPLVFELEIVARDGRRVPLEVSSRLVSEEGKAIGVQGIARDITERKQAAAALEQANRKLTAWVAELEDRTRQITLLNDMGDLLQSCQTAAEAYTIIAQFAPKLFPAESGMLAVLSPSKTLVEGVAVWGELPVGEPTFAPEKCWALRRGRMHFVDAPHDGLLCGHVDPSFSTSYLCLPMMAQGEPLGVLHLQGGASRSSQADASAREMRESQQRLAVSVSEHIALALANLRLQETLRSQAIRDPLTGLFNRRYMEESLEREIRRAGRTGVPVGIIMLDIDHFKRFNDTFGHEAGDTLLGALGNFVRAHIRAGDIACRYGGEEFTLILPEATLEATRVRAEQLREGVKKLQVPHRGRLLGPITLSLGVATFPDHGSTSESLLSAADGVLYRAKQEGRDRVVVAR